MGLATKWASQCVHARLRLASSPSPSLPFSPCLHAIPQSGCWDTIVKAKGSKKQVEQQQQQQQSHRTWGTGIKRHQEKLLGKALYICVCRSACVCVFSFRERGTNEGQREQQQLRAACETWHLRKGFKPDTICSGMCALYVCVCVCAGVCVCPVSMLNCKQKTFVISP